MDPLQQCPLITIRGPYGLIKRPFSQTILTGVIVSGLRSEGLAADGAQRRGKASKIGPARRAEEWRSAIPGQGAVPQESAAYRAPRGKDGIDQECKQRHYFFTWGLSAAAFDSLTNSSKEQSGLIPRQASFAISQVSLSATLAG